MIKTSLCHKRRTHLVKHIAIMTTLIMVLGLFPNTFINNYFKTTITANAEDTTWTIVDYSTMTDANLSAADIALMHDNNWLNQYVATKRSKTLETLTLADFLSVTSLTQNSCSLTTVPDSIKFMVNLTALIMQHNNISSLPKSIGNLTKLWKLDCLSNQITTLPDSIGNLTKLTYLDFSSNQLTALPSSIGNLNKLCNLYIINNKLTTLPNNIGTLTSLHYLYCTGNQITILPDSICNLTNLWGFDCMGNQLTSLPSNIGNLINLTSLVCSYNNITNLPSSIGNLSKLTSLDCSNNQLTSLPSNITNLVNLIELYCSNNFLTLAPINPPIADYSSNFIKSETNQNQLSFISNNAITVVNGESLDISKIINTVYDNGLGPNILSQSVISSLQLLPSDPTIIDTTSKALKTGTITIRVQMLNNPIDNTYGITQVNLQVTVLPLSENQNISVTFTQEESIELTLSTNTVTFGDVTGIQTTSTNTTPIELIATVKSSLPYDLNITATDNFTNKTDITASQIPITKLGIKVDNGEIIKFDGVNISKTLVSNESATSAEATVSKSHTINFSLDQTIGYKAGNYEAPITITAIQK